MIQDGLLTLSDFPEPEHVRVLLSGNSSILIQTKHDLSKLFSVLVRISYSSGIGLHSINTQGSYVGKQSHDTTGKQYTNYSIIQRDRPKLGTVELAWLDVLCLLACPVECGLGCVEWLTEEFVPDSKSTGRSNGTTDWLKNRGPIWPGTGTSLFDPNEEENVGIGWRVTGKSNFSSEKLSSSGSLWMKLPS